MNTAKKPLINEKKETLEAILGLGGIALIVGVIAFIIGPLNLLRTLGFVDETSPHDDKCVIKGNVSYEEGEKIYHLPGQKYYEETNINTDYGEKWFCNESDARKEGFRKAFE